MTNLNSSNNLFFFTYQMFSFDYFPHRVCLYLSLLDCLYYFFSFLCVWFAFGFKIHICMYLRYVFEVLSWVLSWVPQSLWNISFPLLSFVVFVMSDLSVLLFPSLFRFNLTVITLLSLCLYSQSMCLLTFIFVSLLFLNVTVLLPCVHPAFSCWLLLLFLFLFFFSAGDWAVVHH
jgi:hypothetical protein